MAGFVEDRWTRPGPNGRRVKSERHGKGMRWRARLTLDDGRERSKTHRTRDAAELWLAKQTASVADGTYIDPSLGRATFRAYAESWREQQVNHRRSTRAAVEMRLRVTVYPAIGDRAMASLRRSDIQLLVSRAELAPATVRGMYAIVTSIFSTAVQDRVILASPCVGIKMPEVVRERVLPLTVDQVALIRSRLPERLRAVLTVVAHSGLRPSECIGLTVDRITPPLHVGGDVPPRACVLEIDRQLTEREAGGAPVFGPPKTPSSVRSVRLGEAATRALAEQIRTFGLGPEGLVFRSADGGCLTRHVLSDAWRTAVDGMGLAARSGFHAGRHFHASLLIAGGASPTAVAARLGHKDATETLAVYSHLWVDDDDRMVASSDAALLGL
jgi:integrase